MKRSPREYTGVIISNDEASRLVRKKSDIGRDIDELEKEFEELKKKWNNEEIE